MYMNVDEIESALQALAAAHPNVCQLITLPHQTFEGRTTHAVRLGTQPAGNVDAFYFTGGVHAREWGSCDILVNLAVDLCDAYVGGTGVGYGGKYFSAAEIRVLIEQTNLLIYPCVNPDGRNYSQNVADWRRNRNPADSGGDATKIGVDINRNQDFLWDFTTAFAPGALNTFLASTDPADETYHGHAPTTEAETQNVNYIHDTFDRIRWYVDVHSYGQDILYVWGDDEVQVSDPTKNFRNGAYDHKRGLLGDAYSEYIDDGDLGQVIELAEAFTRSLFEVRGTYYVAKPSFSLYATSGTNEDYAYSRHITDPPRSKALSFTVEWGATFQPLWPEMQEVIKDVCSGLMGLALEAVGVDDYIVTNRDTFSNDEVEMTRSFDNAFYVIYDGFSPAALGAPGTGPAISFHDASDGSVIGSMSAAVTAIELEQPTALGTPQRVSFTHRVDFADTTAFTVEDREIYVRADFGGMSDVALLHLLKQPNPYMLDGPVSWLSTDLRVFQLRPGQKVNSASTTTLDQNVSAATPHNFIQTLLAELRGYGNTPATPFESISQDEEQSRLELSRTVDNVPVFNFAVAKVRYRATVQDAMNVRVFFRGFNVMVSDLSYTQNSSAYVQNYRRTPDGSTPLLGLNHFYSGAGNQIVSIPYFAEPRIDSASQSMLTQPDGTNELTIHQAGGQEAVAYFGCWLDFNQTDPQFPANVPQGNDGPFLNRLPILQFVRGIHQCLVAEVRFQPGASDPIPTGATPFSSDRLSQRNLALVESDNPGPADSHRVQHTLLVKPSATSQVGTRVEQRNEHVRLDELVIRWGDVPRDAKTSIYFPDWSADEVLALAEERQPAQSELSKLDPHTIACRVTEISYIPLPARIQTPMPGLLTVELPAHIRSGERYEIDVQQHSGPSYWVSSPRILKDKNPSGDLDVSSRRVLGAFRVAVAVSEGTSLLERLVRNLAVLRYIEGAIPTGDSWRPVFARYIGQLAKQVAGLGYDPDKVPASADDPGLGGKGHHHVPDRDERFTGKVCEVRFDCFGALEGFTLVTCDGRHSYRAREQGLVDLLLRACQQRLTVTVTTDDAATPRAIAITCC